MSTPAPPRVNEILDQMVFMISRARNSLNASRYITEIKSAERGYGIASLSDERPCVRLYVSTWNLQRTSYGADVTMRVVAECLMSDGENIESDIQDLIRDVIVAIAQDESLDSLVQYIWPVSYTLDIEAMQRLQLGVGKLEFEAFFTTSMIAP